MEINKKILNNFFKNQIFKKMIKYLNVDKQDINQMYIKIVYMGTKV
jgi:hypothetical protein